MTSITPTLNQVFKESSLLELSLHLEEYYAAQQAVYFAEQRLQEARETYTELVADAKLWGATDEDIRSL